MRRRKKKGAGEGGGSISGNFLSGIESKKVENVGFQCGMKKKRKTTGKVHQNAVHSQ